MKIKNSVLLQTFACTAGLIACGGSPLEEEAEGEAFEVGTSASALWSLGSTSWFHEWDSGNNNSLSGWQDVTCVTTYGPNHLVAELVGYPDVNNFDNFLIRLEATCREYESTSGDSYTPLAGTDETDVVYSGNYLFGATSAIPFATGAVPVGVQFYYNNGDNYVKDIRLIYELTAGTTVGPTNYYNTGWTTTYTGTLDSLECNGTGVMTGIGVNYSTINGKARAIRIFCRDLDHS